MVGAAKLRESNVCGVRTRKTDNWLESDERRVNAKPQPNNVDLLTVSEFLQHGFSCQNNDKNNYILQQNL